MLGMDNLDDGTTVRNALSTLYSTMCAVYLDVMTDRIQFADQCHLMAHVHNCA